MEQQKALFDGIRMNNFGSGIDYDLLAMKIGEANEKLPNPIIDYREFTEFTDKVVLFNEKITI
jgi:hypothetical protein